MKTAKLVIGIITIVLSVLVSFQSCAVGISNIVNQSEVPSGTAGMLLSLCFLTGGIIGITTRKSKGGSITAGCFYIFGGIIALPVTGDYSDLVVWSVLGISFGLFFIISVFFMPSKRKQMYGAIPIRPPMQQYYTASQQPYAPQYQPTPQYPTHPPYAQQHPMQQPYYAPQQQPVPPPVQQHYQQPVPQQYNHPQQPSSEEDNNIPGV